MQEHPRLTVNVLNMFFSYLYNHSPKEPTRPAFLHDQSLRQNLPFSACRLLAWRWLLPFHVATGIAAGFCLKYCRQPMAGLCAQSTCCESDYIPVYVTLTVSRFLITCVQVCLDISIYQSLISLPTKKPGSGVYMPQYPGYYRRTAPHWG